MDWIIQWHRVRFTNVTFKGVNGLKGIIFQFIPLEERR